MRSPGYIVTPPAPTPIDEEIPSRYDTLKHCHARRKIDFLLLQEYHFILSRRRQLYRVYHLFSISPQYIIL